MLCNGRQTNHAADNFRRQLAVIRQICTLLGLQADFKAKPSDEITWATLDSTRYSGDRPYLLGILQPLIVGSESDIIILPIEGDPIECLRWGQAARGCERGSYQS